MTIDPALWGWPQYFVLLNMFIGLILHAALNGREKTDSKYCAACQLCMVVISAFVLWAGGFW